MAERSLPPPQDPGSNQAIGNFRKEYSLLSIVEMTLIKIILEWPIENLFLVRSHKMFVNTKQINSKVRMFCDNFT